jgi:LacI family transcriptional regulator, galactose operon repressor
VTNLKTLSDHLGLSQATVSRALNGYSTVKASTRQRVEEAAKRLNYRPNSSAQRLATGRAGAFGIIVTAGDNMLIDPHFTEFLAGLTRTLAAADIDILMTAAPAENQTATYRRFADSGKVDGFIVSAPKKTDARIEALLDMDFPFVVHGQCQTDKPYSYFDIDNVGAFEKATDLLLQLGHRRIAILNGTPDAMFAVQRHTGYMNAHRAHAVTPRPDLIVQDLMTEEVGYHRLHALLGGPNAPTAVLCSSMILALGAQRAMREKGLRIGRDISIISHDDGLSSMKTENFSVPLTVTRAPIRQAGSELASMLQTLVDGGSGPIQKVVPVDLIVRDSTAPAPAPTPQGKART